MHHLTHRRAYKKRTAIALEIARQLEEEGHFPQAHYAFDKGLLTLDLARFLERVGQHRVSAVDCARHIQWSGQWHRVDMGAAALRQEPPERFRPVTVRCHTGERKPDWVFTKVVRLKRDGRKRLGIVHATAAWSDAPRLLLTEAQDWESGRGMVTTRASARSAPWTAPAIWRRSIRFPG